MTYNVKVGYRTWKEEGFEVQSKYIGTVETETPDTYFGILTMNEKEYKSTEIRKGIIDLMAKELNGFMDALVIIIGDAPTLTRHAFYKALFEYITQKGKVITVPPHGT